MQTEQYLEKLWQIYREYARYNKGLLLKNDTPADFLAEIEKAFIFEQEPPVESEEENIARKEHYKHLKKYLEIINK